ncbi:SET and MYND domain-containing protein 4 [Branchiostoma belcheri]|nr:SET and MYND domain-containing protein 4 [Branchiostoma belcheri]
MATSERWRLFQKSCEKELGRRLPEFSGLNSNEERARFCLQLSCWEGDTLTQLIQKLQSLRGKVGKSTDRANQLRDKGNTAYKAQHFQDAFTHYTDSISYSPVTHGSDGKGSECLSLALANRSAVLFHLQEYKLCLQDIIASIEAGYPENLQYKLLHRKVLTLFKLGRNEEAKKEVKAALEAIERADIQENRKEGMRKELKSAGRNISKQEGRKPEEKEGGTSTEEEKLPELQYGESRQVAHASVGVEMRQDPGKGRMLVAQQDFEPGSVLIVEQPYAAVLLQKHHPTHCHSCITPVQVPHPCRCCQFVQYCSRACEEQAWKEYHSRECEHWHLLQMVDTFGQLSLRLLLTAAARGEKKPPIPGMESSTSADNPLNQDQPESCAENVNPNSEEVSEVQTGSQSTSEQESDLSVPTESLQTSTEEAELHGGNYSSLYSLMPHTEHHSAEQLLTYTMVACLMCKCLGQELCAEVVKRLGLEGGDCGGVAEGGSLEGESLEERQRRKTQLRCNTQAISTLQEQDSVSLLEDKQVRLATAVFPTEALLNHSCRPNVFVSFQGKTLIVRAVSHIKAGEELLHCYGPHAGRMGRTERQAALLEQYYFSCSCDACQEEEDNPDTVDIFSAYKCPVCSNAAKLQDDKLTCTSNTCNTQADTDDIKTTSKKIQDLFIHEVLRDDGDCKKSVEHLKKSLSAVELQFGACSVELAHELHKLAQLQFNGQQVAECLDTIDRALTIFGCHYGDHHPKTKELKAMKDCLIDVLV